MPGTSISPLNPCLLFVNSLRSSSTIFDLPAAVGNTIRKAFIPASLRFCISCKLTVWCSYNSTFLSIFKPFSIKSEVSFPKYCLISSSILLSKAQSSVENLYSFIPQRAHVFCFLSWFLYFSSPAICGWWYVTPFSSTAILRSLVLTK